MLVGIILPYTCIKKPSNLKKCLLRLALALFIHINNDIFELFQIEWCWFFEFKKINGQGWAIFHDPIPQPYSMMHYFTNASKQE
jgi:membrane-bound metal-dependent hydrolase YbcI (DUF457 family)